MADFSDPTNSGSARPKTSQQPSLEVGLAALKQRDYARAIAQLEAIALAPPHPRQQLKAQMGLVKAYERSGRVAEALHLCQQLQTTANAQVQQWAQQTLAELVRRHPSATADSAASSNVQPEVDADLAAGLTRRFPRRPSTHTSRTVADSAPSPTTQPPISPRSAGSEPLPDNRPAAPELTESLPQPWRQAGRAQTWGSLGPVDRSKLWGVALLTVIALFWVVRSLIQLLFWVYNGTIAQIRFPIDLRYSAIYSSAAPYAILGLLVLVAASPWLMTELLTRVYRMRRLSPEQLAEASPESVQLLKRVLGQQRRPMPQLGVLPVSAPLAFTYSRWPPQACIVVSQGLLQQLEDDEIATLIAAETSTITLWTYLVLPLIVLAAQLPYQGFRWVASWGDRQTQPALRAIAMLVSSMGYSLFTIIRLLGLWLARVQTYYGDRTAAELTGNPNGLARALLKVTMGLAQTVSTQQQTSPLLESFDLLLPVGTLPALNLGSLYSQQPDIAWLNWDRQNPYRRWLSLSTSHPPLGDRLHLLTLYARRWRLPPELDLEPIASTFTTRSLLDRTWLLQLAPFLGAAVGVGLALVLWLVGLVGAQLNLPALDWLWGDRTLVLGLGLIGFGLGTFVRLNRFFPEMSRSPQACSTEAIALLTQSSRLPIHSLPIRLQGTLLGRRGMMNLLGQDWVLRCDLGLIKLHHKSALGPFGNLVLNTAQWQAALQKPVIVTGWLRRGAIPWLDVDTLSQPGHPPVKSSHPYWSTVLGAIAALAGCYLIFSGGS